MALTPDDIVNPRFSTVRRNGYDPDEVQAFVVAVAQDMGRHDEALARAKAEITRLAAELNALREKPVDAPDSELVGTWVSQIIAESERAARGAVAEADAEAMSMRNEAHAYAARVRSEVDAMRLEAENEIAEFRRQTVAHAEQVRIDAERRLEAMQVDAEQQIREVHATVSAELAERTEAVRRTEQLLLARLVATAQDVGAALRRFHEVESVDEPEIDLRETTSPSRLHAVDTAEPGSPGAPFSGWNAASL